jgi:hypothetical protein
MAIAELYSGSATISTTEISLVSGTSSLQSITTDGIYQAVLDLSEMANGDVFELRIKEKARSGDTQRIVYLMNFANAQTSQPNAATPSLILMHGWDITIIKISGTDRAIPWSIRQVA